MSITCQLTRDSATLSCNAPPRLRLPRLERVALNGNQIGGAIPDEMGQLFSLRVLDLSWNRLVSFVPPKLGNLANLTQLLLYHNRLSGSLPARLLWTVDSLTAWQRKYVSCRVNYTKFSVVWYILTDCYLPY